MLPEAPSNFWCRIIGLPNLILCLRHEHRNLGPAGISGEHFAMRTQWPDVASTIGHLNAVREQHRTAKVLARKDMMI